MNRLVPVTAVQPRTSRSPPPDPSGAPLGMGATASALAARRRSSGASIAADALTAALGTTAAGAGAGATSGATVSVSVGGAAVGAAEQAGGAQATQSQVPQAPQMSQALEGDESPTPRQRSTSCGGFGCHASFAAMEDCLSASPTREIALQGLHTRSAPLGLAHRNLLQGLDGARRLDALDWLVQAFDALGLPDTHLFGAFGLLDRFAASSPAPISAGPGAFALVLASMVVALKVSGTQRDLDRAKRLVVEVSGSANPWASVRKAELCILRRLGFRACTPTALDLLDRIVTDAWVHLDSSLPADAVWDTDVRCKCVDVARFLLELALVHEPWSVYGNGRPPMASAVAALLLARVAFSAPSQLAEALQEPLRLLEPADIVVTDIAEAMRERWSIEEKRTSSGSNSAIMDKWQRRMGGSLGVSPPSAGDLRYLITSCPSDSARTRSPWSSFLMGGKTGSNVTLPGVPVNPTQSTATAAPTAGGTGAAGGSAPCSTSMAEEGQKPLTTPRPALCPAPATGPALASRFPPTQVATQLSRTVASENLSSWPLPASGCIKDVRPASPQQAAKGAMLKVGPRGAQHAGGQGIAGVDVLKSPEKSQGPPAQSLVELAHVLNAASAAAMAAKAGPGSCHGTGPGAKPRAPHPVVEVLCSSALRWSWPDDRRKVSQSEASEACRDAVLALQEAASQLEAAAALLDGGTGTGASGAGREFKAALGLDSRRRRTFAGPTLTRAPSPGATGPPAPRGSPPVRFSGLRV